MLRVFFSLAASALALTTANALAVGTPKKTYDPDRSRMMATAAQIAYCEDVEAVEKWTCGTCEESGLQVVPGKVRVIEHSQYQQSHATRVVLAKIALGHGCIVSFRGSHATSNWISDMDLANATLAESEHCPGCWVGKGFFDIWNNVAPKVVNGLADIGCKNDGKDNQLYITGHSLGAAVAHLAMFSMENMGYEIKESYSYESPRVGNPAFAAEFNARFGRRYPVFRVTRHEDPVVHVPYQWMGFKHVETEVYYDETGHWKVCDGPEDYTCSMQWMAKPWKSWEHCLSPLVPGGDICSGCNTAAVLKREVVVQV